jgi:ATP-dependent Lhr-like helicase
MLYEQGYTYAPRVAAGMSLEHFHPIVRDWFQDRFSNPTDPQRLGWPEIAAGRHTLIAAPTGSGKTLAAFLTCIDGLLRQAVAGELTDQTQVVYISPLKALSNDVRRNLQRPLEEITACAAAAGHDLPPIRALLRTGDTTAYERQSMLRRHPHILVTTPESLYLLLTSARGRDALRNVRTVIVDEIHALARDKRGSHLTLSLERLEALCGQPPLRIGLSATQRPMDEMARFLVGAARVSAAGRPDCAIVDTGHARALDLALEVPPTDLSAVCSKEQWEEIYTRLCELIGTHHSTLIFVNTRRLAERVAHQLSERLGEDAVASHHGSLSREIRLSAEERLQSGQLKAIVATASLELGIDVGFIDLVCQIGSPRSIATVLQRVGRSGHSLGATPKGRLFPLTRDELLECLALVRAVRQGRLDRIEVPLLPRDILAQQIVAEVAAAEWDETALYNLCRRAWPFRDLTREVFDDVVEMVSEGIGRGTRRAHWLHRDRVNGRLKARRGARIAALTSGGAIPELADYRVVTEDEGTFVGTVNEDFAIESMSGDVFLLGNTAWRVRHVRGGEVVVADAQGAPATIPFWLGEAPGRTIELSRELAELREEVARRTGESGERGAGSAELGDCDATSSTASNSSPLPAPRSALAHPINPPNDDALTWLRDQCNACESSARQAADYIAAQVAAVGLVPTTRRIMFERFFDESGGMQLVIHAPLGARINRAWGLAMRKRFCRSFDFELQASATDNGVVLSLGPQHSFPLEQMFRMLNTQNARHMLTQAMLAVPVFKIRWRWNSTRSLAVLRHSGGRKVPPPLQRFRADDLLTAVFPAQTACQENRPEDIEIPRHPLIDQTVHDCLHENMDLDRWLEFLADVEAGRAQFVARDTREPSPFSYEILNANPYAFLDDAPLEERRARAVATRRTVSAETLGDLAWLDPAAIAQVRADAWPVVRDADELHDALLSLAALPERDAAAWGGWFAVLSAAGRATTLRRAGLPAVWVAAERLALVQAALKDAVADPPLMLPEALRREHESTAGLLALVRGRMEVAGPTTVESLADALGLESSRVEAALEAIEAEGCVMRGAFTPQAQQEKKKLTTETQRHGEEVDDESGQRWKAEGVSQPEEAFPSTCGLPVPHSPFRAPHSTEWCDRRLLARIHRLTLDTARRAVQPAEPADFVRFLIEHQHLTGAGRLAGRHAILEVIGQLQGFEAPAGSWERDLLPGRIADYDPAWLDEYALAGEIAWGRLQPPVAAEDDAPHGGGLTRVVPISLTARAELSWLLPPERGEPQARARGNARLAYDVLAQHGACFFQDLISATGLLPAQLEDALSELAALGVVSADGFSTIRALVAPDRRRASDARRRYARRKNLKSKAYARGGRWCRFPGPVRPHDPADRAERWARQLLRRYGVVFRDLLARESVAPAWREVAAIYRRLEAQGRIRGGRFVSGVAGEQFALPEAVTELRRIRETPAAGGWTVVSACDPLNLAGILTPGPRVPAVHGNALAWYEGRLIATLQAGEVSFIEPLPAERREEIARAIRVGTVHRAPVGGTIIGLPKSRPGTTAAAIRQAAIAH